MHHSLVVLQILLSTANQEMCGEVPLVYLTMLPRTTPLNSSHGPDMRRRKSIVGAPNDPVCTIMQRGCNKFLTAVHRYPNQTLTEAAVHEYLRFAAN